MGRIDGNPTPVNYPEEQDVELHHQTREEEDDDYDYEPVGNHQHRQEEEKSSQKPRQQSPHHYHYQAAGPQPYLPPHHAQPQAVPPRNSPQAYPPSSPHNGNYGQPQVQPHMHYPQPVNYNQTPPLQNNYAQASPVPAMGVAQYNQQLMNEGWRTGLFDCCDDPTNALVTACFPCVTFGQIAEILDNGQTSCGTSGMLYSVIAFCIAVPCIMSCTYRTKLRHRYGLIESPAPDWITHCFCEWCALCQEYRELQKRGMDPAIGWQGNLSKNQHLQQQQVYTRPPMNQTMMG